ncbi:MAG: class I SAM-dependent methyltransferase [Clostridiales bacterium]|nr:class I SAM-dependent methyltransferase [Clostridiales bacterium]MBR6488433.1 class I SAM-dependent methyltransferase [Clostridiales bacterium]
MDTSKIFDGYAKDYTVGRPDYAPELIECMYGDHGFSKDSVIADVGSGTGKFARHLIERGSEVYCVEPSDDMRQTAENELSGYPNFHSVKGDAEHSNLGDSSVDFVTTAQAFHWFDVERFRAECKRILKSGGRVFLIWNMRGECDALNREMHEIYEKYCPDFRGFNGGIKKNDERIKYFFENGYEYISFDHPLYLDRDTFIARSLSGSYSLQSGNKDFDIYMSEIEDVFEKNSVDGMVTIANMSVAYFGTP